VWRVLTSPAVSARWRPTPDGWLAPPPERIAHGEPLRFRARLRCVPVAGELRVLEVLPGRARVQVRLGLFAFEARFSLGPEPGVDGAARVGLLLACANRVALVGGSLDRFEVRRLASEIAEQTLAALTLVAEDGECAAQRARCAGL
jgi:hypothetical protein